MRLYRYMSQDEFDKFLTGTEMVHEDRRKRGVDVFCFLPEVVNFYSWKEDYDDESGRTGEYVDYSYTAEECYAFMTGIVSEDILACFEIPQEFVEVSHGETYADPTTGNPDAKILIDECWVKTYSTKNCKLIRYATIDHGKFTWNSSINDDPQWITRTLKRFPKARRDVLTFIDKVNAFSSPEERKCFSTSIEKLFTNGFCYYFALMLHDAFGGTIVWHKGYKHILWMDENDIVYDIFGVYDGDIKENFIPIDKVEKSHPGFLELYRHRNLTYKEETNYENT